jgi:DivIVA domain-containing protein
MAGMPQADVEVGWGETKDFRVFGSPIIFDWKRLPMAPFRQPGPWIVLKPWPPSQQQIVASEPQGALPPVGSVINLVDGATFRKANLGYNMKQVDEFLAGVKTKTRMGDRISPSEISDVNFDASRGGYHVDEVDQLLATIARAVTGS